MSLINYWGGPIQFKPALEVRLDHTAGRITHDELRDIFDWVRENITGKHEDRIFQSTKTTQAGITFFFENEIDATAFKMRWIE